VCCGQQDGVLVEKSLEHQLRNLRGQIEALAVEKALLKKDAEARGDDHTTLEVERTLERNRYESELRQAQREIQTKVHECFSVSEYPRLTQPALMLS